MARTTTARVAALALGMGTLGAVSSLEVTAPSEGLSVVADRTYTVEWTGTEGNNLYEIDLYYCGSSCAEDDCGDWVAALCDDADGCSDIEGNYDVVMPEPLEGVTGSGYKVRVMDVNDESNTDCSADFTLVASGDSDEAFLVVTAPEAGNMAYAGDEYTVEFDYDNGVGSSTDRFSIDLYMDDGGDGDCGTYVTSICDKPTIGCKDSQGDYDVTIPEDTVAGEYSIRVGRFEDESLFGCSGTFEVISEHDDSLSYEFSYSFDYYYDF
eukprot:jgi/Undpi1/13279/HiC_scaffold_8.g02941.m1